MDLEGAVETFMQESDELLEEMEQLLISLEQHPDSQEQIAALFRAAHTIKGSSAIFGYNEVVSFTHEVEDLLDSARQEKIKLNSTLINKLLPCVDHIRDLIKITLAPNEDHCNQLQNKSFQLINSLNLQKHEPQAITDSPNTHPQGINQFIINAKFNINSLRDGMDPASFLRYIKDHGQITEFNSHFDDLPDLFELDPESCYCNYSFNFSSELSLQQVKDVFEFVEEDSDISICIIDDDSNAPMLGDLMVQQGIIDESQLKSALEQQSQISRHTSQTATLRVDALRLDHLIDLVGELVIAGANNSLIAKQLGISSIIDSTATVSRLIEEIRDSSLHLRMVQIGQTFNRFHRTVRDISTEVGKEVKLTLNGEDTELDRSVVEKLGDPLMHMIRNAIDHGIEPAAQRQALGKPQQGQIHLNARHESGSIVIEVQDDGKGLDKEKILSKAIENGLTSESADLKDSDIFQFIFEPSFSTASTVSALSGRGVGMDVVRKNIEGLRGSIEVESTANIGTSIRVRLPLTLAIIDGFLVKVAENTYVIPVENVIECMEFKNDLNQLYGFTNLRGELLPYLRLRSLFAEPEVPLDHQDLVVIGYGKEKAGLIVDGLLGEFQTVIKPLGKIFNPVSWITGSTILGNGEVAVILDVAGLIQLSKKYQAKGQDK